MILTPFWYNLQKSEHEHFPKAINSAKFSAHLTILVPQVLPKPQHYNKSRYDLEIHSQQIHAE